MEKVKYLALMILGLGCFNMAYADSVNNSLDNAIDNSALQASVAQFVEGWDNNKPRYKVAFYDLDSDKKPEAIVYLQDSNWCGSGGCSALILQYRNNAWKIVTKLNSASLPISVLTGAKKGWQNLSVHVRGGGIVHGYDAILYFNGKTYPRNPTLQAKATLKQLEKQTVLIADN